MQTAAYSLNIGSCWINMCDAIIASDYGQEILKKVGFENYKGIGCVVLGYPAKEPGPKKIQENRIAYFK